MVKCAPHPQSYKCEGNPKVTSQGTPITFSYDLYDNEMFPKLFLFYQNASQCPRLKHLTYACKIPLSLQADVCKKVFHLDKGH